MEVHVTLHAGLSKGGKTKEHIVRLVGGQCTLMDVISKLGLSPDAVGLIFVNDVIYKEANEIFDGDKIALLPHMEGG
ncbi:MAG: hypothetical protein CVU86_09185 [Firmicutes bacterium HGW-Firmicutes-11]|jgi:sulfur carrier protein ThiS|nr:MAG: hypothetical protein CVU86_09185 [Firmicutes bacterium HGW-Firmicutes-11]